MSTAQLDMSAESEIYFLANWTDTLIDLPEKALATDGLIEWIALNYLSLPSDLIGFNGTTTGRIEYTGTLYVTCYNKSKKLCLGLAGDVEDFFEGLELPLGITVGIAQYGEMQDLDNNYYGIDVSFRLTKC